MQGTLIASYLVNEGLLRPGDVRPSVDVLNRMGYDAAGFGDHEFDFGLEYRKMLLAGAEFPYLAANIYRPGTQEPYFTLRDPGADHRAASPSASG